MKYSKYQEDFFHTVRSTKRSILVRATAGSGKTTTGVAATEMIDPSLSVIFLAFNKPIAEELSTRVASNVETATLNSVGFKAVIRAFGYMKPDEKKTRTIYRALRGPFDIENEVLSLVGYGKASGDRKPDFSALAEHFGVVLNDNEDKILAYADQVYQQSLLNTKEIDFDDQILFPALGLCPVRKFDVIFIDEAQDLNGAQIKMLQRMLKAGGRVIAIGDKNQSIYGFRGADARATEKLVEAFDMVSLPLSISYRCAKAIVRNAQTVIPEIEYAPDAPEGEVVYGTEKLMIATVRPDDLILCRTNAPLVHVALSLIRDGRKAAIKGRNFGAMVGKLIDKVQQRYHTTNLQSFLGALQAYCQNEIEKLMAQEKTSTAMIVSDQWETILALSDGVVTTQEIIDRINTIFSDDKAAIQLSSVHKSKGLEADRVFVYKTSLMPHKMAKMAWAREQEIYLKFVAYTRAKTYLMLVD